jgi:RND family efflux transporter MFP subunit
MNAPATPPRPEPDLAKLRIDRDAPSPALRRALWRNLVLALVVVGLVVATVLFFRGERPVSIQVFTVNASPSGSAAMAGATSVTANGYVVARTRAAVSARLAGRLAELRVSEGSVVRRGEVIGRLESADYQAQVTQAEAALATSQAEVTEAEARRDQLVREAQRVAEIRRERPDLMSEQEVEAAQSAASQAQARARATTSRVAAAEAELRYAQATLEHTVIRAPFNGTVLRKEAEVGEVVAPSVGGGLTRGAVVTMADLQSLEVEVDVNEAYIARVGKAQAAVITLDAYPDTTFRGRVRQVVPTADRQRATVQVKVTILDRDPRILPEMGARVDFLEAASPAAAPAAAPRLRVPAAAVKEREGRSAVWLVRQGRLESHPVEAGPVSGGFREIRSGLLGGEVLMVEGVESPREGMRVVVP